MNPQNPGQFGNTIGGAGPELLEAMKRRGLGGSATGVVSPASPTAPNNPLPSPVTPQTPQAVPQRQPLPAPNTPGGIPTAESTTIVKALSDRLKRLGDLTEQGFQV